MNGAPGGNFSAPPDRGTGGSHPETSGVSGAASGGAPSARGGSSSGGNAQTAPKAILRDANGCESLGAGGESTSVRFAVLGDYGYSGPNEAGVAALVKSWNPEFVLTTGDNNYPEGSADTIDANIGQYFHDFICPYRGGYGAGATKNRFFPALGNHDWYTAGAQPYLQYFTLPGNERYYEVLWGSVHVFVLDSDPNEPDGVTSDSRQAAWLKARVALSPARWQIVTMHHPPYSSGPHASTAYMQWPYKDWGIDLVLAGHDHDYERIEVDGLPYVVTGLGGASIYQFGDAVAGSETRYNATYGATLIDANSRRMVLRFFTQKGVESDQFTIGEL
jgi:hypothetical protein